MRRRRSRTPRYWPSCCYAAERLDDAFWTAFMDRCHPRVKAVVEASVGVTSDLREGARGRNEHLLREVNDLLRTPA